MINKKPPAKTEKKQDTKFKPGSSGNPAGRPQGSRHTVSILLDNLLSEEAVTLTKKAIKMALAGDGQTLRALMDKLLPNRKDSPISIKLPKIGSTIDLSKLTSSLLSAVGDGQMTPSEAAGVARLVEAHAKAIELAELDARLTELEKHLDEKK
jgi:hypothetical protein